MRQIDRETLPRLARSTAVEPECLAGTGTPPTRTSRPPERADAPPAALARRARSTRGLAPSTERLRPIVGRREQSEGRERTTTGWPRVLKNRDLLAELVGPTAHRAVRCDMSRSRRRECRRAARSNSVMQEPGTTSWSVLRAVSPDSFGSKATPPNPRARRDVRPHSRSMSGLRHARRALVLSLVAVARAAAPSDVTPGFTVRSTEGRWLHTPRTAAQGFHPRSTIPSIHAGTLYSRGPPRRSGGRSTTLAALAISPGGGR